MDVDRMLKDGFLYFCANVDLVQPIRAETGAFVSSTLSGLEFQQAVDKVQTSSIIQWRTNSIHRHDSFREKVRTVDSPADRIETGH